MEKRPYLFRRLTSLLVISIFISNTFFSLSQEHLLKDFFINNENENDSYFQILYESICSTDYAITQKHTYFRINENQFSLNYFSKKIELIYIESFKKHYPLLKLLGLWKEIFNLKSPTHLKFNPRAPPVV